MFNSLKKSGGLIASLVVVAAVLPIVLVATLSEDLRLRSFASQNPELRIWTDPRTVVTRTGKPFTLKVYAEAKVSEQLIPEVKLALQASEGVEIEPAEMDYKTAFNGKVLLGEVKVKVNHEGVMILQIPESKVFSQLPNLQVTTQGTEISTHN